MLSNNPIKNNSNKYYKSLIKSFLTERNSNYSSYEAIVKNVDKEDLNSCLRSALKNHAKLEIIKLFLKHGAEVNTEKKKKHEKNALYYAVVNKAPYELIRLLIESGATTNYDSANGGLLHIAIKNNLSLEIIKLLVESKAPIHLTDIKNGTILEVLFKKCIKNEQLIKYFLEIGADVAHLYKYKNGLNVLHDSLREEFAFETIKLMCVKGFPVTYKDVDSEFLNALQVAFSCRASKEIIYFLFGKIDSLKLIDGHQYLTLALKNDYDIDMIKFLLEKKAFINMNNECQRNALGLAALKFACYDTMKLLIDYKMMPLDEFYTDILDKYPTSVWWEFILNRANEVISLSDKITLLKLMITSGANINVKSKLGKKTEDETLLFALFDKSRRTGKKIDKDTLSFFIDHGVDVSELNTHNLDRFSNYLMSALEANCDTEVIHMLIEKGLNINHKDKEGKQCLHYAINYNPNIENIKYLIRYGVDTNYLINYSERIFNMQSVALSLLLILQHKSIEPLQMPTHQPSLKPLISYIKENKSDQEMILVKLEKKLIDECFSFSVFTQNFKFFPKQIQEKINLWYKIEYSNRHKLFNQSERRYNKIPAPLRILIAMSICDNEEFYLRNWCLSFLSEDKITNIINQFLIDEKNINRIAIERTYN